MVIEELYNSVPNMLTISQIDPTEHDNINTSYYLNKNTNELFHYSEGIWKLLKQKCPNEMVITRMQKEYFQHFISDYNKHMENGKLKDAHHCCVAVLLELEEIFKA